jgi:hypothetical protein
MEDDKQKTKRGGARRGAGKPRLNPDAAMEHKTITLSQEAIRKLLVLGGGNLSEGVRKAADVAYDRYIRS